MTRNTTHRNPPCEQNAVFQNGRYVRIANDVFQAVKRHRMVGCDGRRPKEVTF